MSPPRIRAQTLSIDVIAPPPVKPSTIPKTHSRKRSRVRRKHKLDRTGADDGGNDGGLFGCGAGPFGGGGYNENDCLNFEFKRVVRIFVDGSADPWCLIFKPMWWPLSRTRKSQTPHLCTLHKINIIIFITTTPTFHHLQNPIQRTRKRLMLTTVVVLFLYLH
ncbi:hypothetical protein Hanom_Chr09g00855371 [Helianthus anomalus]